MEKCMFILDSLDSKIIADSINDENWKTGDRIVYDDYVLLILDYEIIDNIKKYRVKIK